MDYESENHSKHLLIVHFIFVCKYRKKLLLKMGDTVKRMVMEIADEQDFSVLEMEVDKDHIHLLIQYNPAQSILSMVRLLKQLTTYRLWRESDCLELLSKNFWKEKTFWSDGYFACSIGNVSKDAITKYIKSQG